MRTLSKTAPLNASDEALVKQFKDGSREAFEALFRRHLRTVYKRVMFAVPVTEVDDVTQEIFIAAYESLHGLRGEAQFSAWLRRLTRNKIVEYYRKQNRKQEPPLASLQEASKTSSGNIPNMVEERILLQGALMGLPEHYFEVITLRIVEGLHFDEVAEVIGQSLEATKSRFRRAIVELHALLVEENTDEQNETENRKS
jgi:RNA polymerase sigma-70 factor (ECF subfamily)